MTVRCGLTRCERVSSSDPPPLSALVRSIDEIEVDLRQRAGDPGAPLVLAEGDLSPEPDVARRWFALEAKEEAITELLSFWIRTGEHDALVSRFPGRVIALGNCDAMYATPWEHVWYAEGGRLHVWGREPSVHVIADAAQLVLGDRVIERARIARLHRGLSSGWGEHWVDLVTTDGEVVRLFSKREDFAFVDPTYDGIDLLCDSAWAGDIARALAGVLGVEVTRHPDLT